MNMKGCLILCQMGRALVPVSKEGSVYRAKHNLSPYLDPMQGTYHYALLFYSGFLSHIESPCFMGPPPKDLRMFGRLGCYPGYNAIPGKAQIFTLISHLSTGNHPTTPLQHKFSIKFTQVCS
jgi:hypothetical protein